MGRMIGLCTEKLEWQRLTVEICVMKRESDRKSLEERNRAPAQSFDHCVKVDKFAIRKSFAPS